MPIWTAINKCPIWLSRDLHCQVCVRVCVLCCSIQRQRPNENLSKHRLNKIRSNKTTKSLISQLTDPVPWGLKPTQHEWFIEYLLRTMLWADCNVAYQRLNLLFILGWGKTVEIEKKKVTCIPKLCRLCKITTTLEFGQKVLRNICAMTFPFQAHFCVPVLM